MGVGKYISDRYQGSKIGHIDKRFHKYEKLFKDEDCFCAYAIENVFNEKIYVGITKKSIFKRVQIHFNYLVNGKHPNPDLQKDYNKYGETAFKVIRLRRANNLVELNDLEILFTNHFNSTNSNFGYNRAIPGIIVRHTEKTKARLSVIKKQWSLENPNNVNGLLKASIEKRHIISEKQKVWNTKNPNPASNGVIVYNTQNGKQYFFWCMREMTKTLGINNSSVHRWMKRQEMNLCKGKPKMPYFFKFVA